MINILWDNLFRSQGGNKDIANILHSNFIFETLSARELKFVESIIHKRKFRPGEIIFRQGEVGVGMYILVSGSVNISVEDMHTDDPERRKTFITRLSAGDFFGEIALVEKSSRRTATASAVDEVTVLGFFQPDLTEIIDRNPRTGVKIISRLSEVLGRRLKETAERFSVLKREFRTMKERAQSGNE